MTRAVSVVLSAFVLAQPPRDLPRPRTPPPGRATAVIRGHVVAAATGDPIANAEVAVSGDADGERPADWPEVGLTDASGRYEMPAVSGRLAVEARKPGYTMSFYGMRRRGDPPRTITVPDGAVVDGIDIAMRKAAAISGRIVDEFGDAVVGGEIIASRMKKVDGHLLPLWSRRTATDDLGEYRLSGLDAGSYLVALGGGGEYVLRASRPPPQIAAGNEGEFALRIVTVGDRNLTDLAIATTTGSSVRGRVLFDGDAARDVSVTAFPVGVDRSLDLGGAPAYARPRADSTFALSGLHGPRRLTLLGGSPQWSIKSIRAHGVDLTDAVLPFGTPDQSLDDVEITLTTHAAEIAGAVVDARGHAVDDFTVIVYAADRARWYRNSRFMKFAKAQRDRSYRVNGLPPGAYVVAAVDRMEGTEGFGEWQDPDVLEALAPRATRIVLAESQHLTLTPRLIVR